MQETGGSMIMGWQVRTLIKALNSPRLVLLLGAGASAPDVPTIAMLRDRIKEVVRKLGPIARDLQDREDTPLIKTILSDMQFDDNETTYVRHIVQGGLTHQTLELIVHTELTPPESQDPLPQYEIFNHKPARATLLNYNTDGLATRFCGERHLVLPMHGSVDAAFTERLALKEVENLREVIELAQALRHDDDIHLAPLGMLHPEPEPDNFLEDAEAGLNGKALADPSATSHRFSGAMSNSFDPARKPSSLAQRRNRLEHRDRPRTSLLDAMTIKAPSG